MQLFHEPFFIHFLLSSTESKSSMEDAPGRKAPEEQRATSKELEEAYKFLGQKEELQKGGEHTLTISGLQCYLSFLVCCLFNNYLLQVMLLMRIKP